MIAQLEFELAYLKARVSHFTHYTRRTLPSVGLLCILFCIHSFQISTQSLLIIYVQLVTNQLRN